MSDETFLSRWSRRKLEVKAASPAGREAPTADAVPAPVPTGNPSAAPAEPPPPLPPVESLTPESDFAAFMKPHVEEALKRQALKALFRDPRFNVMDGLDVYIDDYSRPDPIPASWLEKLNQMAGLDAHKGPAPQAQEPAKEGPEETRGEGSKQADSSPAGDPTGTASRNAES